MELTKPFSPRPSKSLHHFNFLLGCSIGVLGESGEDGGWKGGGWVRAQTGERLQTRPGEWRESTGEVWSRGFISRGPEVCGNAAESGEIRGKMQHAAVRGLRHRRY